MLIIYLLSLTKLRKMDKVEEIRRKRDSIRSHLKLSLIKTGQIANTNLNIHGVNNQEKLLK